MKQFVLSKNEQQTISKILANRKLCDFCIGRLFESSQDLSSFQKIGEEIRSNYTDAPSIPSSTCGCCDGIIDEIDTLVDLILNKIQHFEFTSFVLGFHVDEDILSCEQELFSSMQNKTHEELKIFLKKTMGRILEEKTHKEVLFDDADIMIIVNTIFYTIDLQIKPLYVSGRYNKYERGIPQTKWFCRQCRGIGCRVCDYTGSQYQTSVEEIVGKSFLDATNGSDWSFHGSGREDIDVVMLGSGRPFVIEISDPKKRSVDLETIQKNIATSSKNIVTVSQLKFTEKKEISRIKQSAFNKVYKVTFEAEKSFDTEKLKKVALTLRGTIIQQFTPTRVARRRANKVRARKIYDCSVVSVKDNRASFRIESASGTYIKELVTGDEGKTNPNISQLVGQPCQVITLDVLEIKGE